MNPFTPEQHRDALIRRRIKFVAEKGAMARLFKRGTNPALQEELFNRLRPAGLAKIQVQDQYDEWLTQIVELECWSKYSRNGIRKRSGGYAAFSRFTEGADADIGSREGGGWP
jgi:hypothetical protein